MKPILGKLVVSLVVLLTLAAGRLDAATPQEYARALAQVQGAIQSQTQALGAQVISPGPSPSLVAQQVLTPIHSVQLPGQPPVLVDTSQLVSALGTAESLKDTQAKTHALNALLQQIGLLRQAVAPANKSQAAVKASAQAVLSRPEFASDPPPPPSFVDKIAAWLDKVFQPHAPRTPNFAGPNLSVIKGILIAIAAGAFALLVWVLVQAIGKREARQRPLALDEEEAVLVEARDTSSLLALAEQQASAGNYRRAFRLVYLASLVALDTNGVLHFDRSKTNWEYLRALRAAGRGDVYAALTPLTREFDQVWYGLAPADASQYARALAQYQALQAAPPAEASGAEASRAGAST